MKNALIILSIFLFSCEKSEVKKEDKKVMFYFTGGSREYDLHYRVYKPINLTVKQFEKTIVYVKDGQELTITATDKQDKIFKINLGVNDIATYQNEAKIINYTVKN
jgi:hypothetical protein